ncbi:hypothetical protein SUGI_0837350 [Cryptomeria japonica]|uniref:uncharacterized protein LOC131079431 n=1 Tax=Cryptomeria japonica TaxID=3369 RepID=UPI0024146BE4|nr:uncharacterized protein LOC131079431 [Cryptomeria japonica]GLJ40568.1 hypothetical protein SUGI_0837350 [Cryptomeria japonica]
MRIVTARSPSISPPASPSSEIKGHGNGDADAGSSKRWGSVLAFPSSKRVQRPPYSHSAHHSHSRNAKSKQLVWARVSDRTPNAHNLSCEDLEVSATAVKRVVIDEFPDDKDLPDCEGSEMDCDEDSSADGSGPQIVDVSHKFAIKGLPAAAKVKLQETDQHKLSQRQKQIDYGKNTLGYERYLELVPRNKRLKNDPHTPEIKQVCSKRSWDGQVKKWRRRLHEFDPPVSEDDVSPQLFPVGGRSDTTDQGKENATTEVTVSESTPTSEAASLSIYQDWDEMEP